MQVEILYHPSSTVTRVTLNRNETIQVESGAMLGMSPAIQMETQAEDGLLKSLSRSLFGGESFFMNTFTGQKDGDYVLLAPPLPGDISIVEIKGQTLLVQSGSYLASSEGVQVDTKWSGAETFFSGEGLTMLRISGTGTLIICSYGAIHPMELKANEKFVVDSGHIVTFEEGIGYEVKKVAGWKSTLFSGEGLVVELTGPGKLNLQSHSKDSIITRLIPQLSDLIDVLKSKS